MSTKPVIEPGVLSGAKLMEVLNYAQANNFAFPAVNVIGSSSINAAIQAAKAAKSIIMIQFSNGGAHFNAGKGLDNSGEKAAIAGAVAGAHHVRAMAKAYGVPVILHTDHAARKLLPWIDGLLDANEAFFKTHGEPLFSSHMLDLSAEDLDLNIATCKSYLERMAKINLLLELELGVTGGEEDGVDNTGISNDKLYTQPEHVLRAYNALKNIGNFTIAASFGNVHGVYKPGNVHLNPVILKNSQEYIRKELNLNNDQPVNFVFHGGSGSSKEEIREAVSYGVIKMNIDTDTQWAFTSGVKKFMDEKDAYLHGQIGNPEGADKPNKKYYDPRGWTYEGEKSFTKRLLEAFEDLNSLNQFEYRY